DGNILVDQITLEEGVMGGHLTAVAPGSTLGNKSEGGVGGAIGIRATIGDNVRIGRSSSRNHGARLDQKVVVRTMAYVGVKAVIEDGIKLPGGSNIPDGAHIKGQEEVATYLSSEARLIREEKDRLEAVFFNRMKGPRVVARDTTTEG